MSQKFIESICFKNGAYQNIDLHQKRINRAFVEFFKTKPLDLNSILPKIDFEETYKIRVVYDSDSEDVEFIEYKKRAINSLEIIDTKPFNYSFKFEDRTKIDQLIKSSHADDIIISFNGEVKDSSYANLAFWNNEEWITPETPLLEGVKRAQLLSEKKIKKAPIQVTDLGDFEKVSLINAMLDLGEIEIPLSRISL